MVQIIREVDVAIHAHTNESSRTCWIHQGLQLVGCTNKRGVSTILLDGFAVWRTELHIARRQQIFQHNLLRVGGLIKLVDVDEGKRGKGDVQVELVLEVQLVVVIIAKFWWQQNLAKASLTTTLTANQQRR